MNIEFALALWGASSAVSFFVGIGVGLHFARRYRYDYH
jgi:hypothetical protein